MNDRFDHTLALHFVVGVGKDLSMMGVSKDSGMVHE